MSVKPSAKDMSQKAEKSNTSGRCVASGNMSAKERAESVVEKWAQDWPTAKETTYTAREDLHEAVEQAILDAEATARAEERREGERETWLKAARMCCYCDSTFALKGRFMEIHTELSRAAQGEAEQAAPGREGET